MNGRICEHAWQQLDRVWPLYPDHRLLAGLSLDLGGTLETLRLAQGCDPSGIGGRTPAALW
jgi:hypothetical protein